MNFNDWIGSTGVTILLLAFVLILTCKISKEGIIYLLMNFIGSGLTAVASCLIHYTPFIILEVAWMMASLYGIWKFHKKNASQLL